MAAMRAGKEGTDAYLEDWRREQKNCDDDLQAVVDAAAQSLENKFSTEHLQAIVKNKGLIDGLDN